MKENLAVFQEIKSIARGLPAYRAENIYFKKTIYFWSHKNTDFA